MTTITLEWEPEGQPRPDGRQAWRVEAYDVPLVPRGEAHVLATLRPHNGAYGPHYTLSLIVGSLDLSMECASVAQGQVFAAAWLDALGYFQTRVDARQQAAEAAP